MPVLSTLIFVHFLGRSDSFGFLNPGALRNRIESELEESGNLHAALELVNELEDMGRTYNRAADKIFTAYRSKSEAWDSSAEDLVVILEPWDRQRTEALHGIIAIRQAMLDLLSTAEWDRVFG